MFFNRKHRFWPYLLIFLLAVLAGLAFFVFNWLKQLTPERLVRSSFAQNQVKKQVGEEYTGLFKLLPEFMGFTKPRTYLVLFLNNTELRPGGGFIGSYAVVEMNKGKSIILDVTGTEVLDNAAVKSNLLDPPAELRQHLGVDRWYFRDSNWSPDFTKSAELALDFYKREQGVAAAEIDTVVGITTQVLVELLRLIGPVTVQGIEFTADNVVEKLEYEVEYNYVKRGIRFEDRKQIIETLAYELWRRLGAQALLNLKTYSEVIKRLGQERLFMIYSQDPTFQKEFDKLNWSGRMAEVTGDYLIWVDANLAALKTDYILERILNYSFVKQSNGQYRATAEMQYIHNGKFDWRTTRYRTYTRIFTPKGSELVAVDGAMKWDRTTASGLVQQGEELGKQWFGTFIAIEPGETKSLKFSYILPEAVTRSIDAGSYTLLAQKQLGTIAHGLTLRLDFDKNITSAEPGEERIEWGDDIYQIMSDLRENREFVVSF